MGDTLGTATNVATSQESPHPPTSAGWFMRVVRRIGHIVQASHTPEFVLVGSFVCARYLLNADFSYPSEIILPLILFFVVTAVIFYLFLLIFRKTFTAHVAALPVAYLVYDYDDILPLGKHVFGFLPQAWQTPLGMALLTCVGLGIAFGLVAFGLTKLIAHVTWLRKVQLYKILLFVIAFVGVVEAGQTAWRITQVERELNYQYPTPTAKQTTKPTSKPDVYYLVFDRYASAPTLKTDYNFDNSALLGNLASQGFVTRDNAYANYPFTMQSISSTLAMNYFPDLEKQFGNDSYQTAFPYRSIFNNPPAAQLLKQNGYTYNQVSSWWDFSRVGIQSDSNPTESFDLNIFGHDFYLSDLQRDFINRSVLSPILKQGLGFIKYTKDNNPRENFEQQMSALKTIADRQDTSTPQFTFAHFLVPHDPYIFDADGSNPAYDGNRNDAGIDETQKYTNQVTYLNTRIEDLISNIRKNSPNAAIVIQADEGPYPKDFRFTLSPRHYYDPINLSLQQMQQKFGILASYYMPGVDAQTVTQGIPASVDPLRFVLSHYLGYDLPTLPDCQFATGDKYVIYKYQQVTGTLRSAQNPVQCKEYE